MTSEESIFREAIQKSVAERAAFLTKACGGDLELRRRVELLLQSRGNPGDDGEPSTTAFIERPNAKATLPEDLGTLIGPYKLLEEIGEGGFGVVWMAEQTRPLRRKVALKVLKPGMDTKQIVARFEAERQALALMDHANIAKVYDAGVTPSGRPFFVMELVIGVPITDFCDQNHLTARERLELFTTVCQAVQHAHHKGIIHRDLKPANVLVTVHHTTAVIKVIDFGIAKALGQALTDKTLFTGFAQMIGTPLYMSPEQTGQSGLDIDTRSDIYALGVLLYELLTGTTPFDQKRFRQAGYDEIRRIIREEEPARPSTRLGTLGADVVSTIADSRRSDPRRLSRLLRGELDWIVMKAIEKDRGRRYETASAFAADVQRYLHDEPVQACPPSTPYRLLKVARRHKTAIASSCVIALTLLFTLAILAISIVRIKQERDQKESAFEQASANAKRANQNLQLARSALDEIYLRVVEDRLPREPQLREEDLKLLRDALAFYQRFAEENSADQAVPLDLIRAYRRIGDIQRLIGQNDLARQAYTDAVARAEQLIKSPGGDADHVHELAITRKSLGEVLFTLGEKGQAAEHAREAIRLLTALASKHPAAAERRSGLAQSHHLLADVLGKAGDRPGAEKEYRCAIDILVPLCAEFPNIPSYRVDLASGYQKLGGWMRQGPTAKDEMENSKRACEIYEGLVQDFPGVPNYKQYLAISLNNLGTKYPLPPNWELVERLDRRAIDIQTRLVEDFPGVPRYRASLATFYTNLGEVFWLHGDIERAIEYRRKALDLASKLVAQFPDVLGYRESVAVDLYNCGEAALRHGDLVQARRLLEQAVQEGRTVYKTYPNNERIAGDLLAYYRLLLETLVRQEDYPASFKLCDEAIELDPKNAQGWWLRAHLYETLGHYDETVAQYCEAVRLQPESAEAHFKLGVLHAQLGRWREASLSFDRGLELVPADHLRWYHSATLHLGAGDIEGYRRTCRAMLERFRDTDQAMIAERLAKASLLRPDALSAADFDRAQNLAERAVTGTENDGFYHYFVLAKALADCRAGRYAEVGKWLDRFVPNADGSYFDATAFSIFALTQKHLGHTEQAASALAKAKRILARVTPDPANGRPFGTTDEWNDWLHADVLCREATDLLNLEKGERSRSKKP